ncbi:SpoIIE family protein phosphatase [Streptomyces spiralis]|uniref:SpoIIE family protein phosphatase n=1 Tax=Streptomyces spiralis TaxID=66376 RepID=UPI0033D0CE0B
MDSLPGPATRADARYLNDSHDLLLGVDPHRPRGQSTVDLPTRCTVLLYADGLIERRGESLDAGLPRLRRHATALAREPPPNWPDAGGGKTDWTTDSGRTPSQPSSRIPALPSARICNPAMVVCAHPWPSSCAVSHDLPGSAWRLRPASAASASVCVALMRRSGAARALLPLRGRRRCSLRRG